MINMPKSDQTHSTIKTSSSFDFNKSKAVDAQDFIQKKRWPNGPICPRCGEQKRIYKMPGGYFRCNPDLKVFTVRTGTILERSKVDLNKWIKALDFIASNEKKTSSVELSNHIGVTQKTGWLILKKLRNADKKDILELERITGVSFEKRNCNNSEQK